jgi:glutamyl-tRNA reductase
MFLIDIAVPRNIDPAVNDLENIFLYDIDDLQGVVNANLKERNKEAERAESIVSAEVDKMIARLHVQEVAPTIISLQEQLEEIRSGEVAKTLRRFPDLTPQQRDAIEAMTRAIVNKVAHGPISAIRHHAGRPEGAQVISAIRRVFHIDS